MTQELEQLLEKARRIEISDRQLGEQRRSFAYGNTHIENERITRQMVEELDTKLAAAAQHKAR